MTDTLEPILTEPVFTQPVVAAPTPAVGDSDEFPSSAPATRRSIWLPEVTLAIIALIVNAWGLSNNGWGNTYYAAAARSMTQSWKNFFYGSFDPGGWVTVDKPPAALWAQAASAKIFGYSQWSLLLPAAVAGALSVWMLTVTVRRVWGRTAGLVAGAVLLLTPAMFAVSRSNNPDVFVVFAAVGAAWALERAVATGRLQWMLAVGAWCGLGFLAKLLAIGLIMPGLWAAYLIAGNRALRTRVVHCLAGFGAFLVVAAVWVLPVQLTSASSRPYIGGSTDGTALDLVFGYNGLGRVTGNEGGTGGGAGPGFGGGGRPGGFGAFGGKIDQFGGATGIGRLFNNGMGDQIMWLAPLVALVMIGGVVVALRRRRRDARLGLLVMFTGWAVVTYLLFAYASGIYHNYYVSLLAPALAALIGMGVAMLGEAGRLARLAAAVAMIATAALAVVFIRRVNGYQWLQIAVPIVIGAAAIGVVASGWRRTSSRVRHGMVAAAVAACCFAPAAWVWGGTHTAQSGTFPDARLGAAGGFDPLGGGPGGGRLFGGQALSTEALAWLRGQRTTEKWLYAGSSAMETSATIIAGDSVMAVGGFSGSDQTMSQERLAQLVERGELRFVKSGGGFGGFGGLGGGNTVTTSVVPQVCSPVSASNWGGDARTSTGLYDCQGQADAIRNATPSPASSSPAGASQTTPVAPIVPAGAGTTPVSGSTPGSGSIPAGQTPTSTPGQAPAATGSGTGQPAAPGGFPPGGFPAGGGQGGPPLPNGMTFEQLATCMEGKGVALPDPNQQTPPDAATMDALMACFQNPG